MSVIFWYHLDMASKTGETCTPNINTKERRTRLGFGLIMLAVSLTVWVGLIAAGVSPWWRLSLFPLFMGASVGFFQWRDKT